MPSLADTAPVLLSTLRELRAATADGCRPPPDSEVDPAKAEIVADLKRELESLRSGIEELEQMLAADAG